MNGNIDDIALLMHGFKGIDTEDVLKMHGFSVDEDGYGSIQNFNPNHVYTFDDGTYILQDCTTRRLYLSKYDKVINYPVLSGNSTYQYIQFYEQDGGMYCIIGTGSMIFKYNYGKTYSYDYPSMESSTLTFRIYRMVYGTSNSIYTLQETHNISNIAATVKIPCYWYSRGNICPPIVPYCFGYDPINKVVLGEYSGGSYSQDGDKMDHYIRFTCSLNTNVVTLIDRRAQSHNSSGVYFSINIRYFEKAGFGVFYRRGRQGGGDEYGAYSVKTAYIWKTSSNGYITTTSFSIGQAYDTPPNGTTYNGCFSNVGNKVFINTGDRYCSRANFGGIDATSYNTKWSESVYEVTETGLKNNSTMAMNDFLTDAKQKFSDFVPMNTYYMTTFLPTEMNVPLNNSIEIHSDGGQEGYQHLLKAPTWTGITNNVIFKDVDGNVLPHHLERQFPLGRYFRVKMDIKSGWNTIFWENGSSDTSNPSAVYDTWVDFTKGLPSSWTFPSGYSYTTQNGLLGNTTTTQKEFIDTKIKITQDMTVELAIYPSGYWQFGLGKHVCDHGYRYDVSSYLPQDAVLYNNKDGVKSHYSYGSSSPEAKYQNYVMRTYDNGNVGGNHRRLPRGSSASWDFIVGFESKPDFYTPIFRHAINTDYYYGAYNNLGMEYGGYKSPLSVNRTRNTSDTLTIYNESPIYAKWFRIRKPSLNTTTSFYGRRKWIISDGTNTYTNLRF